MFKVGDIITDKELQSGGHCGLYLVQTIENDYYNLLLLAHTDDSALCGLTTKWYHINPYNACLAFEEMQSKASMQRKCHCSKEVWMYQGCKCGGV